MDFPAARGRRVHGDGGHARTTGSEERGHADRTVEGHGGTFAAARAHGIDTMFTPSGGRDFPLYDVAVGAQAPLRVVDVRHEQTAECMLYGHDVAADPPPGTRYDDVVRALGGAGETITRPEHIAPAPRRAFDSGVPYLPNVLTDPEAVYPRTTMGV